MRRDIARIVGCGVEPLIFAMLVARQHEATVAIAAFHEVRLAHLQINARMAQRAAAAIAHHPVLGDQDDFRRLDRGRGGRRNRGHGVDLALLSGRGER